MIGCHALRDEHRPLHSIDHFTDRPEFARLFDETETRIRTRIFVKANAEKPAPSCLRTRGAQHVNMTGLEPTARSYQYRGQSICRGKSLFLALAADRSLSPRPPPPGAGGPVPRIQNAGGYSIFCSTNNLSKFPLRCSKIVFRFSLKLPVRYH